MSPFVQSTFKKLAILTGVLIVVAIGVYFIKPEWLYQGLPFLFLFFIGLTMMATFMASRAGKVDAQTSTTIYLGIMAGRLIISAIVLAIVIMSEKSNQLVFIANFFALYLCYAIFDITGLVANLRTDFRER